jgi:hypothetical protein
VRGETRTLLRQLNILPRLVLEMCSSVPTNGVWSTMLFGAGRLVSGKATAKRRKFSCPLPKDKIIFAGCLPGSIRTESSAHMWRGTRKNAPKPFGLRVRAACFYAWAGARFFPGCITLVGPGCEPGPFPFVIPSKWKKSPDVPSSGLTITGFSLREEMPVCHSVSMLIATCGFTSTSQ